MEKFFTTNIWGLLLLGALGSILGYILIVIFNVLKRRFKIASANISEKKKLKALKIFKDKYISEIVTNEILKGEDHRIIFYTSNLLINLIFNIAILLFLSILLTMLLLRPEIPQKAPLLVFAVGIAASYPSYHIGYYIGMFKRIYRDFLRREKHKHNVTELEQSAENIFNVMKKK